MAGSNLPTRAGTAQLLWQEKVPVGQRFPYREGQDIFLPLHPKNEHFLLEGGRKILLLTQMNGEKGLCFFAGQDEKGLFLNQLEKGAFQAYLAGGENALNNFLKPRHIRHFESRFGVQARRQGDVLHVEVAASIEGALAARSTEGWLEIFPEKDAYRGVSGLRVSQSRHFLTGCIWKVRLLNFPGVFTLASGVLEAPDHEPRTLSGVHILGETKGRIRPSKND
jgi:hypothetical protein